MTNFLASKARPVSWLTVGMLSAGLVAAVLATALLWPQPVPPPTPVLVVEPPAPFAPSKAVESANDLAVLRTVLEKQCGGARYVILSSEPEYKPGRRSSWQPEVFPEGLACPGVRIVDSGLLEAIFSKPYQGKPDPENYGGWGNFYQAYPQASGMLHLSLPSYTSPTKAAVSLGRTGCHRCGAGWEYTLLKVKGKWTIQDVRPSWQA